MLDPQIPLDLAARVERLEARLGRRVRFRLVRLADPRLRGRIVEKAGAVELECNDVNPGYFWHLDVLRELLAHADAGRIPFDLWDVDGTGLG